MEDKKYEFPIKGVIISLFITFISLTWLYLASESSFFLLGGIFFGLGAIGAWRGTILDYNLYKASKNNDKKKMEETAIEIQEFIKAGEEFGKPKPVDSKILERELQEAKQSQMSDVPWEQRYFTEPCPYCGHIKVRYSNWDDKRLSVAFWGGMSSKIGKAFHCDYCNRTFNKE